MDFKEVILCLQVKELALLYIYKYIFLVNIFDNMLASSGIMLQVAQSAGAVEYTDCTSAEG